MADTYSPKGFRLKEGADSPWPVGTRVEVRSDAPHPESEHAGQVGDVLGYTPFRGRAVVQADDGQEFLLRPETLRGLF